MKITKLLSTISIVLLILVSSVQAADIDDLDPGDKMYLKGILSDDLVYIVRINYSKGKVKIRKDDDGTTEWVLASKLISSKESTEQDIGRVGAGIAILYCISNPDDC